LKDSGSLDRKGQSAFVGLRSMSIQCWLDGEIMTTVSHCLTVVMLCMIICVGCQTSREMSLESSVDTLYKAEQTHDWKTWWSFLYPESKKKMTYEEFVEQWSNVRNPHSIISWKILKIEPMEISSVDAETARKMGITAVVKVPMDITIQYKDKKETQKVNDATDYWTQMGSRWYWYWRGFPTD
jgi:hypothetical protein